MKRNIILAIILAGGLFFTTGFFAVRSSSQLAASLVAFVEQPIDEIVDEEPELLENIEINRDDEGNVEVIATDKDINDVIQQALRQEEKLQGFVNNASVRIFSGYFEFYASMKQPLKGNFMVRGRFTVKDGRLIPEVMKVKYGVFSIPTKLVISMINGATKTQSPNDWIQTSDIVWKSVNFTPGKIVINFQEEQSDYNDYNDDYNY